MAIVSRSGSTYGRLRFSAGPGGQTVIPLTVDWERYPQELLSQEGQMDQRFADWLDEYGRNIHHKPVLDLTLKETTHHPLTYLDQPDGLDELYDRQMLADEFSPFLDEQEVYPWA